MENYATLSLETHLFFARIMKEHGLFLEAGFPCKEKKWIERESSLVSLLIKALIPFMGVVPFDLFTFKPLLSIFLR